MRHGVDVRTWGARLQGPWWVATCLTVALVASVVSVQLRRGLIVVIGPGAGMDDDLFQRQAAYLLQGQWLGPYDRLTLVKGAGYGALVALAHKLDVRLKDLEQLTVLLGGLCLAVAVLMVTRRIGLATFAYCFVALDPANFALPAARVLRQNWYGSLALVALCATFVAVLAAVGRYSWVLATIAAALGGLSFGAFWLTREEGSAFLPAMAVVLVGPPAWGLVRGMRARRPGPRRRRRMAVKAVRVGLVLAVFVATGPGLISWVAHRNGQEYGVALTNDVGQGEVARAYASWSRVIAGKRERYVPISAAQRAAVYAVSPAAAQLRAALEDPANHWRRPGCYALGVCDDYAGGWEIWALREAASGLGYFANAVTAQDYFGRIATDIETGCSDGRLRCERALPAAMQPFRHLPWGATLQETAAGLGRSLIASESFPVVQDPLPVTPAARAAHVALVRGIDATQAEEDVHRAALREHVWRYRVLSVGYAVLGPLLLLGSVVGVGLVVAGRRRRETALLLLVVGGAVGALCRAFVLGAFETSQFTTVGSAYHAATRTQLLVAIVAGLGLLLGARRDTTQPTAPGDLVGEAGPPSQDTAGQAGPATREGRPVRS